MKQRLTCWHCGSTLGEILLPLSRRQECEHCGADQHTCKMCEHYSPSAPNACREDRAEPVTNKERANFCDYFIPNPRAYSAPVNTQANKAAAKLAELFGEEAPHSNLEEEEPKSKADAARDALEDLFKK